MLVWGLVMVIVDFRIDGLDIIPDLVGWALCLPALADAASRTRSGWFSLATAGAALGLVSSILSFLGGSEESLVVLLETLAMTAVVFGTCSGVIASHPDPRHHATANIIRWMDLALTVVLAVLILAARDGFGIGAEVLFLAIPAFVLIIWFLVFVNRIRPEELRPMAGAPA